MSDKDQVAAAISRAQAELERALDELDQLPAFDPGVIAFTAHALNNYLTVTGGTVELLLLSLADYPDANVRNWVEGLEHATELMQHTVNQLITSTSSQDIKFHLMKWDLLQLVQRACNYYQRVAERKKILILCHSLGDVPPVWTDPVAVAAILDNLLSNAVKYSQPGKRIWVQLQQEEASVVCCIRDEGPGLSPEDQLKLFQRGVRLSPRPTGNEPSSGYGLAVAKELAEKLGGQIWCESQLGLGSSFSFRLPAYQAQSPVSEPQAPDAAPGPSDLTSRRT
ncbi:MAG: HAMP domain-containing histidine kinase [Planctomycetes bacterium]|nr:HAMP domain-containing histidine kinase [Planctomycetota bacterium]